MRKTYVAASITAVALTATACGSTTSATNQVKETTSATPSGAGSSMSAPATAATPSTPSIPVTLVAPSKCPSLSVLHPSTDPANAETGFTNEHAPLTCSYFVAGGSAGFGIYAGDIYFPAIGSNPAKSFTLSEYHDTLQAGMAHLPAGQTGSVVSEPQFGPDAFAFAETGTLATPKGAVPFGNCTLDAPAVGGKIVWVTVSPTKPGPVAQLLSQCEAAMKSIR